VKADRHPRTILVSAPEPEVDPHLLMLDGRDVRAVNRTTRRKSGFRGPAFTGSAPSLVRYVRRHAAALDERKTRRQRKVRARALRAVMRRGMM